jgi:hypothetical protein
MNPGRRDKISVNQQRHPMFARLCAKFVGFAGAGAIDVIREKGIRTAAHYRTLPVLQGEHFAIHE